MSTPGSAPRAARGTWLERLAELDKWKAELDELAKRRSREADEFRARWRAAGGSGCDDQILICEFAERLRDESWFEAVSDWCAAHSRFLTEVRVKRVTVAKALELSPAQCKASGLKPTQSFHRWLTCELPQKFSDERRNATPIQERRS